MAETTSWTAPADMDAECVALCTAMNKVPGIRTIESCCGHGRYPYRVWFIAESLDVLPELIYWFAGCHCGHYGWRVIVTTDCVMSDATFRVEGPIGAFDEADHIAQLLEETHGGAGA